MDALNVSSQDEAERLERRLRSISERLEETEDRLDRLVEELRLLRSELNSPSAES
jgi:predicted  nucleic acid-binding Zn-ribbon protein